LFCESRREFGEGTFKARVINFERRTCAFQEIARIKPRIKLYITRPLAKTQNCCQDLAVSVRTVELLEKRVAGRLAGRLAGHVQAANLPSAAQVVSWMDLVDLCRELDEGLVAAEPPSEDALALHEAVVNLAIGCGCSLIHQLQASKVDISASGQTLETLDASLELLRIFYRSRHSELPKGDVEAVRQRIFNAAA